jgi:hypothetical protein
MGNFIFDIEKSLVLGGARADDVKHMNRLHGDFATGAREGYPTTPFILMRA